MQIIDPDPPTRRLLDRFEKSGGALEFVAIDLHLTVLPVENLHRKAAALAYNFVQRIFQLEEEGPIDESRLSGRPITRQGFFGPMFDSESHLPILKNGLFEHEMRGFAYAFSQPPYNLEDAERLFSEFEQLVFDGFSGETEFWEWDTDGLRYFDAGREWWGTFFWTVRPGGGERIVVVLGSTTD